MNTESDQRESQTPQQAGRMTARERILAALKAQPVDRIPFVPLIGTYTLMEMPPEIIGEAPGHRFDLWMTIEGSRALGCDLMVRHVPATEPMRAGAPHLQSLGRFESPVETKVEFVQGQLVETLKTPVGTLTGAWKLTDRAGWIPHPVKFVVESYEDMNIFHYAVDHLSSQPPGAAHDIFLKVDEAIGDDGIATVTVPNSPLMHLIEMLWGLESTYYLLHDHREEVEDIVAKLHASLKRYVEVLAATPAKIVIQYENTSSTLLSPDVFRRYCLPFLNEYADIITGTGKIFLIHMCGTLHHFMDDISQGRFNGIADITPPPTGDLPLDEAAANLPGKVVVGGIDPITFISRDTEFVKAEVSDLIRRIKPFRGVLLGSADTAPRGTPAENFRLIRNLVDTLGTYS